MNRRCGNLLLKVAAILNSSSHQNQLSESNNKVNTGFAVVRVDELCAKMLRTVPNKHD